MSREILIALNILRRSKSAREQELLNRKWEEVFQLAHQLHAFIIFTGHSELGQG